MHLALVLALRHRSNRHHYSNTALVLEEHLSLLVVHQALVLSLRHHSSLHHYNNKALVLEQHLSLLVVQRALVYMALLNPSSKALVLEEQLSLLVVQQHLVSLALLNTSNKALVLEQCLPPSLPHHEKKTLLWQQDFPVPNSPPTLFLLRHHVIKRRSYRGRLLHHL